MTQDNDSTPATTMVSAGMEAPPRAPMNLLGALGGGTLPPEVLALLAGPPPASTGAQLSNALGAGVFAGRGQPNPIAAEQYADQAARAQQTQSLLTILQQQRAAQHAQAVEQRRAKIEQQRLLLDQQKFAQKKAEDEQARKERRLGAVITVTQGVLDKTLDPAKRGPLAKQLETLYTQTGQPIPPSIVQAWANPDTGLSKDNQQMLASKLRSGLYTDSTLLQEFAAKGLSAAEYPDLKRYLLSPAGLRASGLPNDQDLHKEFLALQKAKGDAFDAAHKEVGRGKPQGDYASELFRKERGKPIIEYNDNDPQDALALGKAVVGGKALAIADEERKQKWEERKLRIQEEIKQRQEKEKISKGPLSGTWIDKTKGEAVTPSKADFEKEPSRYRHLGASEEQMFNNTAVALKMVHDTGTLLDTLVKRYGTKVLAESLQEPTVFNQAKQFFGSQVGKRLRNDPDWGQFFNLVTELNIELARVVGGSGQLRVTVLERLTEAGLKGWETGNVGHRILGTIETSIWNRRQSIINGGMTQGMRQYGASPRETSLASPGGTTTSSGPRIVISPDGKRRQLAPGYPLPEGYRFE